MLQTAGETAALKAVVSEGAGIRSIREQMLKPGARKWLSAPYWATSTAAIAVFSNHVPPPNLKDLAGRVSPRPIFLIYSGHPLGGEELNEQFYAAAGEPGPSGRSPTPVTPADSTPIRRSTSGASSPSSTAHCSNPVDPAKGAEGGNDRHSE